LGVFFVFVFGKKNQSAFFIKLRKRKGRESRKEREREKKKSRRKKKTINEWTFSLSLSLSLSERRAPLRDKVLKTENTHSLPLLSLLRFSCAVCLFFAAKKKNKISNPKQVFFFCKK
jgi:hypothetical protein